MTKRPSDRPATILCVVGARPNFVKVAPILAALETRQDLRGVLVHTGQHYGPAMSDGFFSDLRMPTPAISLGVGSGSHAQQTAEILCRLEPVLDDFDPQCVLVVGDVNSTLAAALVAAKKGIPVAHVEAGLRCFDRGMPEEINRVLTDRLASLLFVTEPAGRVNLLREGLDESEIHFVGNVMIDSLRANLDRAVPAADSLGTTPEGRALLKAGEGFAVVTLHRPSNVDDPMRLRAYLESFGRLAEHCPLVFPVHPRTRQRIAAAGLQELLDAPRFLAREPLSYLAFLGLLREARLVITDSGGIQEEAMVLGVPCLTARDNTERPITIEQGSNRLVGSDPAHLESAVLDALAAEPEPPKVPTFWDGRTAERIVMVLASYFGDLEADRRSA